MGTKTTAWLPGKGWKSISLRAPAIMIVAAFSAAFISAPSPTVAQDKLVHNSATVGTKYGTWGADYTCTTCHSRLALNNAKYINDSIKTPIGPRPVIFDRYTASSNATVGIFGNDERTVFAEGSRNVCEVCHHRTIYHNYSASTLAGLSLTHPEHRSNRKDCNVCHKHKYGYRPPQQGSCVDCHGTPPVKPSDLVTNALGSNPPADAGAHNRHRNIEGMECHTCHNNYGHGLLGNSMIEIGFRIDKRTWAGFSGISTVMSGTFTGTVGADFNNNYAVAPKNPGTILQRASGVTSCNVYCHGDNWTVPSGKVGSGVSWVQGPLGACSNAACHGTTPANPPNPGVPGAHQTHVGTLQQACTKCHDDYTTPHMINGRIKWNLAGQGTTASYKGFRAHSTSTLPGVTPYGSCDGIYCHSNVQGNGGIGGPTQYRTVIWGSATILACDGCHGGRKSDGAPIATGAHTKHIGSYSYNCGECHFGAGADGSIMNHLNSNIEVVLGSSGGSYDQMPVNAPGNGYGNCSATYCHSDGRGMTVGIGWGGGPLSCIACHKGDQPGNAIASGKHTAHLDNADYLGSNFACIDCHASTVSSNTSISNPERHVNRFADYSGTRAGRYTRATGVCSASYCHSDGKGGAAVAVAWNDGSTITDCKGCHGNAVGGTFVSVAGEPNYPNEGADPLRANSHERHMGGTGATTCVYCHSTTMDAAGKLLAGTAHLNRSRDVAAGGGKGFAYDPATRSCSNITCHGGPAAVRWGASFPVDCTGCHGNNALSFAPISSGRHKAHMNNKSVLGRNFACATCHALTARPDDRGIVDTSVHGNGFKNYTGVVAGSRASYSSATGICSASYCHSDGKGAQKDMTASGWKSTATLSCTGCHGSDATPDFASAAGEPNYVSAGPGTLRANDHKNHVDFGAQTCVDCHAATVDATGAILQNVSSHLNRRIDVLAGGGKSFFFAAATKSCSDISCHGGKGSFTQVWGTPVKADCTGCHGNNAASSAPISSGRHTAHINNAALGSNYNCTDCHARTINPDERSFANRTLHGNGFVDYSGGRAGRSATYDTATGACSATYCHSDGKGRQNVPFDLGNGWKSSLTYVNCIGCHGNDAVPEFTSQAGEPNYASTGPNQLRSNSHRLHVGTTGAATCTYCHSSTVNTDGTSIKGNHTNRTISFESSAIIGKTFTPGSGKSCSTIACHGAGSPAATWGDNLGCTGCHGGNATSSPIATGAHAAHINNAARIGTNLGCAECHAPVVSGDTTFSNRTRHADGFVNVSGARAGRNAAACNAAYCHSGGKGNAGAAVVWGTTPSFTNCVGCHGVAATPAFTSQAGEPNYASQSGLFANSHLAHTTKLTDKGAASCTICHVTTVIAAGTAVSASGLHLNGRIEVTFDTAKAGTSAFYNPDKTCSGTSCHGSGNPTWGDAASAGCLTCHPTLPGSHAAHLGNLWTSGSVTFYNFTANRSSGTIYRYGCANCHPTDDTKHRNGAVDIDLSWNKAGNGSLTRLNKLVAAPGTGYTKNGTVSFTCDTVYCHSDGRSSDNPTYRPSPNWYATFSGNRCGMCHDNPPRYAGQSHYVAQSSLGDNGKPPYMENGHMVGIHFKIISKGGTQNGFLGFSSSGSMAHGNTALATTVSCNTCHSGIVDSTRVDTYAMDGTTSLFRCGSCHTATTRTPLQSGEIANTALHVNGVKDVAFAPVNFRTKAQLANVANALGWTRNGSYKADDSYDSFNLGVSTWDPRTRTCLTACHVNQPNITWGAQLQCFSCHANQ